MSTVQDIRKKYIGDADPIPGKKYRSTKTGKIVDGAEAKKICDKQMKIMNGAKMPWDEKTLRKMMDFDFFIPVELLGKNCRISFPFSPLLNPA